MIHALKIHPEHFENVISGKKTFEVRKFDRTYCVGDLLALNEYDDGYTDRCCLVYIDYILKDEDYCKKDMVILGIKPCIVNFFDEPRFDPINLRVGYGVPLANRMRGEK